jgi:biopolymer transport protein ExbB
MKANLLTLFGCLFGCLFLPAAPFNQVAKDTQADLENALAELADVREKIAEEKIPLASELQALEERVSELRRQVLRTERLRDGSELALNSLKDDVRLREDEINYLQNLLTEYLTTFPSRATVAEHQAFGPEWDGLLASLDEPGITPETKLRRQLEGLTGAAKRLQRVIGSTSFEGRAVDDAGTLQKGTFLLVGPSAYFAGPSPQSSGFVRDSASGEPALYVMPESAEALKAAVQNPRMTLPLDPTLGQAIAIASTDETLVEHILKGGIWIFPILTIAFAALMVAAFKAMEIYSIPKLPPDTVGNLVSLIHEGKKTEALQAARKLPGPFGEMLVAGVTHFNEPKELLEEILLERIVSFKPKVERFLSFIAVTAATAPLLGLLGTVTGMINTFKLITIFGTGDARQLSSGISEALITTEFGFIVAIPALIGHAFLNRKAKAVIARMETTAMTFLNGVACSPEIRKAS